MDYAFNPRSDGGTNHALVARWTFDEGAGTAVSNGISTNWPGVVRNMAATNWIVGRGGQALWFDGTNGYVAVAQTNSRALVTSAPFTVTAVLWQDAAGTGIYPTAVSDGNLVLTNRWPGFALRYAQPQNWLIGYAGSTNAAAVGVAATNWSPAHLGRWIDVALSHDGTRTHLFVDGRLVAVATNSFGACRQPEFWIGRGHVNEDNSYWQGKIDDVRVFRAALDTNALVEVNDWIGDPDGDGLNNGGEYEHGTDPRDNGSH